MKKLQQGNNNNKKKVLVADDDPSILEALQLMLEDAGYEVQTSSDGKTVQEVKENLPDVILLDLWMSGMDGRDICKVLKKKERTRHIPIIIFSANRDTERIAWEAGADDFITKPFEMDTLLNMIAKYAK